PKRFYQIINATYGVGRSFRIMEAYIDKKKDYTQTKYSSTSCLRDFLGIDGNESVCDGFVKISVDGEGEIGILFEDKDSNHRKDIYKAITQLKITHDGLKQKNVNVDYAVVCGVKVDKAFKARYVRG